ncbi:MAG TPA: lysylphosphatidylglycerol synthase transmembrane domain-containing protein [Thermoanaerobaculia bacterium]|jgi:uncharacterized protein (TIRG00374 family)|nr:lysylphosphatidylglycerol synthase transmembrane domain-containing protein [Thermoanaerobaculia bacterium]
MRTKLGTLLRLLVACGLVALLLHGIGVRALFRSLRVADPGLLALTFLLCLADRALMIGKWYPLLIAQVPGVPFGRAARAYLAAGFASYFLPASVGADALRSYALGRGRGAVAEVGASVVLERLLGLLGSAVLVLAALLVALRGSPRLAPLLPWAGGVLALCLGLLATALNRRATAGLLARLPAASRHRFWQLLHRLAAAGERYRRARGTVAAVAVLSAVEQLFPVLVLAVLARALGLPISWQTLFIAVPLALFLGRLPISFAGLGVFEGALVGLLGLYGVARADALALGVAARLFEVAAQLPGALFWSDLAGSPRPPGAAESEPKPALSSLDAP